MEVSNLNMDQLVGADANFWRLADRHLARDAGLGEDAIVFSERKPGEKILPPKKEAPLTPCLASALSHGPVNCCFVVYSENRNGVLLMHVHGHWSTKDGSKIRQCWMTQAK